MKHDKEILKELRSKLMNELETAAGEKMSAASIEIIQKLLSAIDNIDNICAMHRDDYEDEDMSSKRMPYDQRSFDNAKLDMAHKLINAIGQMW